MSEALDERARLIAQRGRETLVERLRPAFAQAAAAHTDVVELGPEQLESMVQRAADRADGLQWRRALASAATEELGIGLGEALSHPVVARAQAIVGAPSYEESIAQLSAARPIDGQEEGEPARAQDTDDAGDQGQDAQATDAEEPQDGGGGEEAGEADSEEPSFEPLSRPIRLPAIHLGGIPALSPSQRELVLRFSAGGLAIIRAKDRVVVTRLAWKRISAIEVPAGRTRLRRRRQSNPRLVLRTEQGEASFEIPGVSAEELRDRVAPISERLTT